MAVEQSPEINLLAEALAKAQGAIKNPTKNKEVSVRTKTGGTYKFQYADLTAIIDAIKKPLSDNGIGYIQVLGLAETGKYQLTTALVHGSGQWIRSVTPLLVEEGGNQQFGSALTFMKRYALAALVGVSADSDDDANMADGNQADIVDRPRKPKEPAPSPLKTAPEIADEAIAKEAYTVPGLAGEDGGPDWLTWGRIFIDNAKRAPDKVWQKDFLYLNQVNLHRMMNEAPKMFPKLKSALSDIYPKLLIDTNMNAG